MANFYGASGRLEFVGDIAWPGGAGKAPPDTPFCGFDNENPACRLRGSTNSMFYVRFVGNIAWTEEVGRAPPDTQFGDFGNENPAGRIHFKSQLISINRVT